MRAGGRVERRRWRLVVLVAVASVLSPAVSGARAAAAADYRPVRNETYVDTSRPTPPNGTYPGSPSRSIDVRFLVPSGAGPFPLLIFSHGHDATSSAYDSLLMPIEKAGYLVAMPDYPFARANAPGGSTTIDRLNETKDESFVLDRLLDASEHYTNWLGGLIDPGRIAAAGHSRGGYTTLGLFNSCCHDERFKAVAVLAAALDGRDDFKGQWLRNPPLLVMAGDQDNDYDLYHANHAFYAAAQSPAYFITALGANHNITYAGRQKWVYPLGDALLGFLDTYLRGDPAGLQRLGNGGNTAGATRCEGCLAYRETPTTDTPAAPTVTPSKPTVTTKKPAGKTLPKPTTTTKKGAPNKKAPATPAKTTTTTRASATTSAPTTTTTQVLPELETRIPKGSITTSGG